MALYSITIEGMGCDHCVRAVKGALEGIGVQAPEVALGTARVRFDGGMDEIKSAIEDAGFDVIGIEEA